MNQAVSFGLLGVGGILLTKAITGSSYADVVKGKPGHVPTTGSQLTVAGAGSAVATAATGGGGGVGPFPAGAKVTWERTDQGVDASAPSGTPVLAMVAGTVTNIIDFYKGQPAVVISSPGLPAGATGIYYAEQISPSVHIGQTVQAGQQIGVTAPSGTGFEFGFWKGNQTLAQATTGYVEGEVTQAGQLMHQYLTSLGVKL